MSTRRHSHGLGCRESKYSEDDAGRGGGGGLLRHSAGCRLDARWRADGYRDLTSFGRREEIVTKVRLRLQDDPEWKQLNAIKQTIRTESENIIAEALQPLHSP